MEGNYWFDYTGEDINNDGIGDTRYDIPGGENQDYYPLLKPIGINSNPPATPDKPNGKTHGVLRNEYIYTISTSEPDEDNIYYLFDWGDGSNSGWLGPYRSGEIAEVKYMWNRIGNYEIKVKAKDEYGAESEWGDPISITISRSKQLSYSFPFNSLKNNLNIYAYSI